MTRFYRSMVWFWALLLTFIICCLFSCNSQKRFIKYAQTHKPELAELCTETFPIQGRLIQGRTDTISDTVYKESPLVDCPPVEAKNGQIVINKVKCPPNKIIDNSFTRVDTIYQADTAMEHVLQTKLKDSEEESKKQKERAEKWRKTSIIVIAVLGVIGVYWWMVGRK